MAFNLKGIISLDSSSFSKGISSSISASERLKSSVSGVSGGIKGLGSAFKGIGSSASSAVSGVKTLGSAIMGLKAVQKVGEGIKAGFTQAFDMQGYRVQLETATKDTKKAGNLMSSAIEYANKTPFETGEVAQAAAQMEAYGISSEKWLSSVGDMAGATNKSIMQATEAMADGRC